MDITIEKECSALGGLFQSIVNDLKGSTPVWEDFAVKATKLHVQLKATIQAVNGFLDALQRVADSATNAKGATRDMGTALTRICMRHRSIENRLKTFTSALIDCLVLPLQEKLEEWRRTAVQLDKDHAKDYKKHRTDIKKRSVETMRLQKKVRKGNSTMQRLLDSASKDCNDRHMTLLDLERAAVKRALIEQRAQYCLFVSWFKPVMDGELCMLNEISQLDDVVELLCKHAADPFALPPASEAVITDVKGLESTAYYQTPPSSPSASGGSLGSRKSSYCSLSSADSGTPGCAYPAQYKRAMSNPPVSPKFSSISSQDSGFTSQDALFTRPRTPPALTMTCKQHGPNSDRASTPGSLDSQNSTPSPSPSTATWPEGPPAWTTAAAIQASPLNRPHTISAAYESRPNQKRSILNNLTFVPPRPTSLLGVTKSHAQYTQENSNGKPPLPAKPTGKKGASRPPSEATTPTRFVPAVPDFNRPQPDQVIPQPIYANVTGMQYFAHAQGTMERPKHRRPLSFVGTDEIAHLINADRASSCLPPYGARSDDEDQLIDQCMDELSQLSTELGQFCTSTLPPARMTGSTQSLNTILPSQCSTLPRARGGGSVLANGGDSMGRFAPNYDAHTPVAAACGVARRHSSLNKAGAPPPPVRRNSQIQAATPTAPAVDRVRSRCTTPVDESYGMTMMTAQMDVAAHRWSMQTASSDVLMQQQKPLIYASSAAHNISDTTPIYGHVGHLPMVGHPMSPHYLAHGVQMASPGARSFRANSEPPPPQTEPFQASGAANGVPREALLCQIRTGVQLRRSSTNDKSGPRV